MNKKLPPELDPALLSAGPTMVVGVGFDCPVELPLTRSSDKRGMVISLAEKTNAGPLLILTLADGNGRALAGSVDSKAFPGFLELMTRQCGRMRDVLGGKTMAPPPKPRGLGYVEQALEQFENDPPSNDYQRGFRACLEVIKKEAFSGQA